MKFKYFSLAVSLLFVCIVFGKENPKSKSIKKESSGGDIKKEKVIFTSEKTEATTVLDSTNIPVPIERVIFQTKRAMTTVVE